MSGLVRSLSRDLAVNLGRLLDNRIPTVEPSTAFIIEEGFAIDDLTIIVNSMAEELHKCGARIVCGDTKVVPKGCADGLFINTSGVGRILYPTISAKNLQIGDAIIVSRDIGCHGAAILMARDGLTLESDLHSDCETLWPVVEQLLASNIQIHAMRDATRGGLSAVLNEWAVASNVSITVEESRIPVSNEVKGLCELFGFEPYDLANEGTFLLSVPQEIAQGTIEVMQRYGHCQHAAIIGYVTDKQVGKVILKTPWGSSRYLDLPQGELLPRIC